MKSTTGIQTCNASLSTEMNQTAYGRLGQQRQRRKPPKSASGKENRQHGFDGYRTRNLQPRLLGATGSATMGAEVPKILPVKLLKRKKHKPAENQVNAKPPSKSQGKVFELKSTKFQSMVSSQRQSKPETCKKSRRAAQAEIGNQAGHRNALEWEGGLCAFEIPPMRIESTESSVTAALEEASDR